MIRTIASFWVLALGVTVSAGDHAGAMKLPVEEPFSWCSCAVRNDTIWVMTYGVNAYLYSIVADRVIAREELDLPKYSWFARPACVMDPPFAALLYAGKTHLFLHEVHTDGRQSSVDTGIPSRSTTSFQLMRHRDSLVIACDVYDKRFTASSHNLSREYSAYSYCTAHDGTLSEILPIESGRVISHSFQSTVFRDTLQAVWRRLKEDALLTWVTDQQSSIVFAQYDGESWSEPEPVFDYDGHDQMESPLGLHVLNEQLWCFWAHQPVVSGNHTIRCAMRQGDGGWTTPTELVERSGELGTSWIVCDAANGKIHIVTPEPERERYEQNSFDGTVVQQDDSIQLGRQAKIHSLVSDGGQVYLFYSVRAPGGGEKELYVLKL